MKAFRIQVYLYIYNVIVIASEASGYDRTMFTHVWRLRGPRTQYLTTPAGYGCLHLTSNSTSLRCNQPQFNQQTPNTNFKNFVTMQNNSPECSCIRFGITEEVNIGVVLNRCGLRAARLRTREIRLTRN